MGTLSFALEEVRKPEVKETRSSLMANILRLGDPENNPIEALEIVVKTSKATALARPQSWKRFAPRESKPADEMDVDEAPTRDRDWDRDESARKTVWAQLRMRTEFHVEHDEQGNENNVNEDDMDVDDVKKSGAKVEKEQLIRGFKYGSSYVPCPDGQFAKLNTHMGISICGFFSADNVSSPSLFILCMMTPCSFGENIPWARYNTCGQILVHLLIKLRSRRSLGLWTSSTCMQLPAGLVGTTWNQKWGCLPRAGFRRLTAFSGCRCVCFVCFIPLGVLLKRACVCQMPFADDVRKYTFSPLQTLSNRKGERVATHPYLPSHEQIEAMDRFVDAMDLMEVGEKDDDGLILSLALYFRAFTDPPRNRSPWFDTRLSYNPAIHRTKQALFHGAIIEDVVAEPLPPPHPELTKYFEPPKRALKRAGEAIDQCSTAFGIKKGLIWFN